MAEKHHSDLVTNAVQDSALAARSAVAASWRRSALNYGLDPENKNSQTLISGSELAMLRDRHGALLRVARPILDNVFKAVGQTGCCVVLTTSDGMVLENRTTSAEAKDFEKARLTPGAIWSEAVEGTNGIGTCLAEDRALTIYRDQHFYTQNIGMSCMDAPVRDHKGRLIAALDISTCREDHSQGMVNLISSIVTDAAHKIETEYFRQAFARARIIHASDNILSSPILLAVDNDDLVVGATRAARRLYGLTDEMIENQIPACDVLGLKQEVSEFKDSERAILRRAIARAEGNITLAARNLGIGRATFYRRMKRSGIV